MSAPRPLASKSNGKGEDLTSAQLALIQTVAAKLLEQCKDKWAAEGAFEPMEDYCMDPDTIRRFLVARQWSESKALHQLLAMQAWRLADRPWTKPFCTSPQCEKNPYALCMRVVGLDDGERPVIYSVFSQANDRYDVNKNVTHMRMLISECENVIMRLRRSGRTKNADQMQMIWCIDFHGFGVWDQNPNSAVEVGRLMTHFPEMLHMCVLIDAPWLFNATWKLCSAVLDDRVAQKVAFVSLAKLRDTLAPRLGERMCQWLVDEATEVRQKPANPKELRKYWVPPATPGAHDPRGDAGYVGSEYYIKTPGDAWEEAHKARD